jgi:hypothetical protein
VGFFSSLLEFLFPFDNRWERHKNGLHIPVCFEAKEGPSIVEKVELHITSPPVELILPLLRCEGEILPTFYNLRIGG